MNQIQNRTDILSPREIEDFFSNHLPYRIKILDTVIHYKNQTNTDPFWPSIYESAQITCRMFVEFFGLRIRGLHVPELIESQTYYSKDKINSYEVKIKDLGIEFILLKELSMQERNLLAHAYQAGNRATAHLTYKSPFDPDPSKVIEAAIIIKSILTKRINNLNYR